MLAANGTPQMDERVMREFEKLQISQPAASTAPPPANPPADPKPSGKSEFAEGSPFVPLSSPEAAVQSAVEDPQPRAADPNGRPVPQEPFPTCSRQAAMAENAADHYGRRRSQPDDFTRPIDDLSAHFASSINLFPELSEAAANMYL
ncbi:hypothetical protein M3Y99_00954600 [Aphelenchoides fujianensis]|nr:hypothetical protein M3Y99_00954600 [Aphelenchoides fujianensis]